MSLCINCIHKVFYNVTEARTKVRFYTVVADIKKRKDVC